MRQGGCGGEKRLQLYFQSGKEIVQAGYNVYKPASWQIRIKQPSLNARSP